MLSHYSQMTEYGLIGFPLGHSFSRKFFAEKFLREGIDAEYLNFEIADAGILRDIVRQHPLLRGLNCTIPHKEAIIPFLDDISPKAREIGAVNVIAIKRTPCTREETAKKACSSDFKLIGYNSDIIGFTQSIKPLLTPHHRKALILGTGGASKAVRHGLESLGIEPVFVSRTQRPGQFTYADITAEKLQEYTVIVNCTPVGMYPHIDEAPPLPYEALTAGHLLYDLIYNPAETLFLQKGAQAGATTKNGQEMLELQALASWDFWHE